MTFAPLATFLSTRGSIIVRHGCPGVWSPTETTTAGRTALSAALYQGPGKLMDYSGVAISFFTSIRIPAALVAGSSLATMFANPDPGRSSRLENRVMVLYHMCALLGFLLSLNVVLTSTSTSTVLLLGMKNPLAHSAYELLRRELDYEFTSTRWSFFMALFSFITSVSGRVLVEFRLLRPQRWRTANSRCVGHFIPRLSPLVRGQPEPALLAASRSHDGRFVSIVVESGPKLSHGSSFCRVGCNGIWFWCVGLCHYQRLCRL